MAPTQQDLKRSRLDVRTTASQKSELERAAAFAHKSVSSFVIDAASVEARRVLSEQTNFSLSGDAWQRFSALLDRSPQDNPQLQALLRSESTFSD